MNPEDSEQPDKPIGNSRRRRDRHHPSPKNSFRNHPIERAESVGATHSHNRRRDRMSRRDRHAEFSRHQQNSCRGGFSGKAIDRFQTNQFVPERPDDCPLAVTLQLWPASPGLHCQMRASSPEPLAVPGKSPPTCGDEKVMRSPPAAPVSVPRRWLEPSQRNGFSDRTNVNGEGCTGCSTGCCTGCWGCCAAGVPAATPFMYTPPSRPEAARKSKVHC